MAKKSRKAKRSILIQKIMNISHQMGEEVTEEHIMDDFFTDEIDACEEEDYLEELLDDLVEDYSTFKPPFITAYDDLNYEGGE